MVRRFRRTPGCLHGDETSCRDCRRFAEPSSILEEYVGEHLDIQVAAGYSDFDLARNISGMNPSFLPGKTFLTNSDIAMAREAAFRLHPSITSSFA